MYTCNNPEQHLRAIRQSKTHGLGSASLAHSHRAATRKRSVRARLRRLAPSTSSGRTVEASQSDLV